MPAPNINREIAYIRNQPGGTWLAQALQKLADAAAMNAAVALVAPRGNSQTPAPPGNNGGNGMLLLGNNNRPIVDLADASHANRNFGALSGNLNDVPDSTTRFAAIEASADHTLNHLFWEVAVGQTADPAMNSTAVFTQIDGMSLSVDVANAATCLVQFAGVIGACSAAYSIQLWVDGVSVAAFDPTVAPPLGVSQVFSFAVPLTAGVHAIQAMCANAPASSTWKGVLRTLSVLGAH
ncbi:MAG: hypothetical protein ACRD22_03350 [Terriglobia bacterium]